MKIRQKLAIQFSLIVAVLLLFFSLSVYYFSSNYRKDDFYERLKNKAKNVANILITVDEVDAALLHKIEKDNPGSLPKEKIIVYDYQNQILYNSSEENEIKLTDGMLNRVRLEKEVHFKQGNFEILGFLFVSKFDRFVVIAGAEDIYGKKRLENLRTILIIAFCISLMLAFIAGGIYAGRALVPISNVIKQVNDISIHSINLRVAEGNKTDEIAQLANTFNNMLNRLEIAFKMQSDFISNASHELRNPLTAITGQLEVLLLHERSNEEYKQIVFSVLEDMKHLNRLSNRLLLLAQASSEVSETSFKNIRIDDIVWLARTDVLKRNSNYKIMVSFSKYFNENKLEVNCNEQLMKSAILNLMDNACKYSPDQIADVIISTSDDHVILTFKNTGQGILSEDLEHIFEPFHRGKNAEHIGGHGIGLSLVQKIVEMHHGNIQVSSINGGLTIFAIGFPSSTF